MARGKNISVFLMDRSANGKIKAQISNWNGIAYKIPRDCLADCKNLDEFGQSGVYYLFGYGNVYVGQAEVRKSGKGILQRIIDHQNDKHCDAWEEVVIFTAKDNSLGRTDLSYLENRFYNIAKKSGRYTVLNSNEPTMGTVTEEKEAELEEFIDQAELILGALGYKIFEKQQVITQPTQKQVELKTDTNDLITRLLVGKRMKSEAIEYLKTQGITLKEPIAYAIRQEKKKRKNGVETKVPGEV